jgi:hypothetical protein
MHNTRHAAGSRDCDLEQLSSNMSYPYASLSSRDAGIQDQDRDLSGDEDDKPGKKRSTINRVNRESSPEYANLRCM